MRHHVSLVLALALALVVAACGSDRKTGGQDDAGVQEDAFHQFDVNVQQDAAQSDVAAQADAPPPNYDSGQSLIKCGTAFCNQAAGEECCVTGTGVECVPGGTGSCYGTLDCDGPEDCYQAGKPICCATIGTSGGGSTCQATCTGSGAMTLCRDDSTCVGGQKCCGALDAFGISVKYCLPEADCAAQPADPGVPCGTGVVCYSPDACCMGTSTACMAASSCTGGFAMGCDGPEDCQQDGGTAQVCCANADMSGGSAVCTSNCVPTGLLSGILCHSNADCTTGTCSTLSIMGFTIRRCN